MRKKLQPTYERLLAQEAFVLEASETVCELLEKEQHDVQWLAVSTGRPVGVTKKLLAGEIEMSLRTFADFMQVLGFAPGITYKREPDGN